MNRQSKGLPKRHDIDTIKGPGAELPFRELYNDPSFTITLISRVDSRAEDDYLGVNEFHTGLTLNPPEGSYLEIIPADDLHKHGYFLAPGKIIIGWGNNEELIIPLYKYKEVDDVELPFRGVKMILHELPYASIKLVEPPVNVRGYSQNFMQRPLQFTPVNNIPSQSSQQRTTSRGRSNGMF